MRSVVKYSIRPGISFSYSMPMKIADLIKAKGGSTKYWLYDVGVLVCCAFIGMYLSILLCQ